ncbi:MAG: hypothetical protein QXK11_11990 [Pyrobaculum sp.]
MLDERFSQQFTTSPTAMPSTFLPRDPSYTIPRDHAQPNVELAAAT